MITMIIMIIIIITIMIIIIIIQNLSFKVSTANVSRY